MLENKDRIVTGEMRSPNNRTMARGPRTKSGRRSYLVDEDVLPAKLVTQCRNAFGGKCNLMLVKAGGPLNTNEEILGDKLAWDVRIAMDTPSRGSLMLYIRGQTHKQRGTSELVRHLASRGFSVAIISMALNLNRVSIRRFRLGKIETVQHLPEKMGNVQFGYNVLRQIHGLDSKAKLNQLALKMNKHPLTARAIASEIGACNEEAELWRKRHHANMYEILSAPAPLEGSVDSEYDTDDEDN